MESALDARKQYLVHQLYRYIQPHKLSELSEQQANAFEIWAHLQEGNFQEAGTLLHHYSLEFLTDESTPLHFLYGCWLFATEGKEIGSIHFSGVIEVPYPRSYTLLSYFLNGKIINQKGWKSKSFLWERRQLYRQISLYYHCIDDREKSIEYQLRADQAIIDID